MKYCGAEYLGAAFFTDMGKRIAAAWKGLDEEARAPFLTEASLEMERYQEAKSQLLASQPVPAVQNNDKSEHPSTESLHNESGDHSGTSGISQNNQTNPSNSYSQHEQQQQKQQTDRNNNMGQETTKISTQGHIDPNQTAQAFSPPYPSNYSGHLLHQEYAYQCEVCLTAIFPTYDECAQHEEECAKSKMKTQNEKETLV